jgi:hypothetical protein
MWQNDAATSNTVASLTFDAVTGAFARSFKAYAAGQHCRGLVLQRWEIRGTFAPSGNSTCGGTCVGQAVSVTVTSATITVTSSADVEKLNVNSIAIHIEFMHVFSFTHAYKARTLSSEVSSI